jgi:predicted RNA-binding protein
MKGKNMCESNAYLLRDGNEELVLSEVVVIEPIEGGYRLSGLFGESVTVKGTLAEMNLLKHKIVFQEQ